MKLRDGLAEEALFARIHRLQRIWGASERALGFYLQDLDQRGLYRKHGFADTIQLAAEEFQIPAKKTRELLRTARALAELPRIDEAYAGGRVSWSAVREITRVATSKTEEAWLELAEESGLRRVEGAVSRSEPGDLPPADPYGLTKTKIFAALPLEDYALWQTAFSRLAARHGSGLDSATVLVFLLESFLEQPLNEAERETRKVFQVVYHRCSVCDRAWIQGGDGPQGIPRAAVRKVEGEGEAEVIHLEEADVPRGAPSPGTALVPRSERDQRNTPEIRDQVLGRDGQICMVPGCTNRGRLLAHHVDWRCHGGKTVLSNETCVCQTHHALLHEGLLFVTGRAPHGLEWKGPGGKEREDLLVGCLAGRPSSKLITIFNKSKR